MEKYYVEEFLNKKTYLLFIHYMLLNSDTFSLIYFKYHENEVIKKSVAEVQKMLEHYEIYSKKVNEWPSMVTMNENNHIYKLVMYKAVLETETALAKVDCLFEWDYPKFPMDLCFYKDGYAWFSASSHERYNTLYTNEKNIINDLKQLGVVLISNGCVDDSSLFYL